MKEFQYIPFRYGNVVIGGKVYNCKVMETKFQNGKYLVSVNVQSLGERDVPFESIFGNMDDFKKGQHCTPSKVTPNKITCNNRTYPYIYDEETETARAKYYIKTDNGIEEHEVSIKDVVIDSWACIHTTAIPQDAFGSPSEVIRFKGFIEVDKDGNEKSIGGIGKVIEFDDAQTKAMEQLVEAFKNCEDNGVKLRYDTENGVLRAYRQIPNIKYDYDYYGDMGINAMRFSELHEVYPLYGSYDGDAVVFETKEESK